MVAIISRAPVGFPGSISRSDSKTVQQEIGDTTNPPTAFGRVVKLVSGKLQAFASGDANTVIVGLLARPYPFQSGTNGFGEAAPPVGGILDTLKRGYMTVKLAVGTAAKGGQVYVVNTAGGTVVVGDFVTSASPAGGGSAVAVTGAYFMGPADSNGVTEISYKIN